MSALVLVEHDNASIKDATLSTITAAAKLGEVTALVAGSGSASVAEAAAKIAGVTKVLHADDAAYAHALPENVAPLAAQVMADYDAFLVPATTTGKNIAPRVAALLDVMQLSDIVSVEGERTFKRPIYAGNAIATVRCEGPSIVLGIRPTAFDPLALAGGNAELERIGGAGDLGLSQWQGEEHPDFERPALESAKVIVAGGRGLQTEEGFAALYPLADRLHGAVGASLAAVDAGFAPAECGFALKCPG